MESMAQFIHYTTIASVVSINALSASIGESLTGVAALEGINRQPSAHGELTKLATLGIALIDTTNIMGLSMALILLFDSPEHITIYSAIAELGILLALCLPGLCIGIVSAFPAQAACVATARQPFFAQKILRFMLITQSLIQTPILFGFLIAYIIKANIASVTTYAEGIQYIASGLCIGLGTIGPSIGMAQFAKIACDSIGLNRKTYNQIFSFTFISEAIIEAPIIFSVIISVLIATQTVGDNMPVALSLLSAALCIGLGTFGPGISSGYTAATACRNIALYPAHYHAISRMSIIAQGLIDTGAIFALIIAIFCIV
ncbi:MAG TPA: hypothetical protein VGT41_02315 [Candidatus Babeliales bacterium]|nr:hypothetical protein [Candidatus Babeliales bacterium]